MVGYNPAFESDIFSLDGSTLEITAQWKNPDQSESFPSFLTHFHFHFH